MKIRRKIAAFIMVLAKILDYQQLNKSLCLIFNAIATMNAITFIILVIIGNKNLLMPLGTAGCFLIIFANITDNIPSFLNRVARKIAK